VAVSRHCTCAWQASLIAYPRSGRPLMKRLLCALAGSAQLHAPQHFKADSAWHDIVQYRELFPSAGLSFPRLILRELLAEARFTAIDSHARY
jgi:hypothetical protein